MDESRPWLPPEHASPEGVVGIGGQLRPDILLNAYTDGVFPWFNDDEPIIWWSPDPRCVIEFESFHVPKRLAATIRKDPFRITINQAFPDVIRACGERLEGTWLTEDMVEAYEELHRLGHAHSLECWQGDELAGGIYGVAVGAFFAGESMFFRKTDASKVALVKLVERLRDRGFELFDLQIINHHTAQFHPVELPRREYLERLARAVRKRDVRFEG
jgi:leucyl/phenylalanyl-tRNA--protein transferase